MSKKLLRRIEILEKQIKSQDKPLSNDLNQQLLTRKEVANYFKVTLVTIHNYCVSGILKPYKFGTNVRFYKEDIEKVLKAINHKNNF